VERSGTKKKKSDQQPPQPAKRIWTSTRNTEREIETKTGNSSPSILATGGTQPSNFQPHTLENYGHWILTLRYSTASTGNLPFENNDPGATCPIMPSMYNDKAVSHATTFLEADESTASIPTGIESLPTPHTGPNDLG
jgi:hypothetical protein